MHFLFLNRDCQVSGGTTYLLMLAEGLLRRGHRVTLAAGGGAQARRFDALGVRRLLTPGGKLTAWRVALDAVRHRPDAIVYGGRGAACLRAAGLMKQTGAAGVCVLQDHVKSGREAQVCRDADAVVALEQPIYDQAIAAGVAPESLHVWPRPVMSVCPLPPVAHDPLNLLWIGRMSGNKSWSAFTLIDAMPAILDHAPGARLTIVGGGSRAARARRAARAMNQRLGAGVIATRRATNDPLAAMADASLVVGGGYTCLEALYNGRPAIAAGFEWMGPIARDRVSAGYDQHFGDRSQGRTDKAGMTDAVCEVYDSLCSGQTTYLPGRDWFPVDHAATAQADRMVALVDSIRAAANVRARPTAPLRRRPMQLPLSFPRSAWESVARRSAS